MRVSAKAERLAQALQAGSQGFFVCHSDVHAGNVLIDANFSLDSSSSAAALGWIVPRFPLEISAEIAVADF